VHSLGRRVHVLTAMVRDREVAFNCFDHSILISKVEEEVVNNRGKMHTKFC
jgi:hypothetical protein